MFYVNVANIWYWCCKQNHDVANMFHTHVASFLFECCIFNETCECSNQHEADVVVVFLHFWRIIIKKININWCCKHWFSMFQMLSF
jgi:hypothetical protein